MALQVELTGKAAKVYYALWVVKTLNNDKTMAAILKIGI